MVLFVLVLVLVLVRGRAASRDDADEAPWSFSPRSRPIPEALRDVWWVRHMSPRRWCASRSSCSSRFPWSSPSHRASSSTAGCCSSRSSRSRSRCYRLGRPAVTRPVRVRRPGRVHDRRTAHRRHPLRIRDPRRRGRGGRRRRRHRTPRAAGEGPLPRGDNPRVRDRHATWLLSRSFVPRGHHRRDPAPGAPRSDRPAGPAHLLLPVPRGARDRDRGRRQTAQ